jgi:uncharacterized membrane protein YqjE
MGDVNAYVFNHYFDEMIIQSLPLYGFLRISIMLLILIFFSLIFFMNLFYMSVCSIMLLRIIFCILVKKNKKLTNNLTHKTITEY